MITIMITIYIISTLINIIGFSIEINEKGLLLGDVPLTVFYTFCPVFNIITAYVVLQEYGFSGYQLIKPKKSKK